MTTNSGYGAMARLSAGKKKKGGLRNIGIDGKGMPQHGVAHHMGKRRQKKG